MPAIVATSIKALGAIAVTETTLNGSDTLTYKRGAILVLRNATAGSLTPVVDGAGATSTDSSGLGNVVTSSGYSLGAIAAAAVKTIRLDSISEYLKGVISINSGTGLVATLLEP